MGLFIVADNIWRERNIRRHDEGWRHTRHVCLSILEEVKWCKPSTKGVVRTMADMMCCRRLELPIQNMPAKPVLEVFWCKPPVNWVKLNFDGSSLGNLGRAGAGGVFRDWLGRVLGSYKTLGVFQAEMEGLMHARNLGFQCLWVESDSTAVVMLIQQQKVPWFAA
ncbi:uncharacterized protein LOC122059757 [Macadamia integrifolia]|uniref:uncharacterized protein LOC122059757 n=1 Tax=Macadamia integrifolia TaxID=60698 RepID=UPI001C52B521|nr:uncharacterized protein LOC122059757 [Macadamia integrifolia]